jgi:polysaccharide deacetylase family protein (PEP-CTERM system associated)
MNTELEASVTAPAEAKPSEVANVISVDVEDYFHAEAMSAFAPRGQWDSFPSRVEANTERLLELFAKLKIEATFFVLGWVAERFPALVRRIAVAGHELACHSYWHRLIYTLDPHEFREDTYRAKQVIEQAAGEAIYGYRAPTYSIVSRSLWAADVLAELGFAFDSSIFPIHHDRYGIPEAPRFPFRLNTACGPLLEYPISTFRVWGDHRLPFGGGGYLRLMPVWYTKLGIRRTQAEGLPLISYIHPWEIDPEQPRLTRQLPLRLRHYGKLGTTYDRLSSLLSRDKFTSFRNSGLALMAQATDPNSWGNHGAR